LLKDTNEYAVSRNTVLVRAPSGVVNAQAPSRKQKWSSPAGERKKKPNTLTGEAAWGFLMA